MQITITKDGSVLIVSLDGRLDTTTSPELEKEMAPYLDDATGIVFDLTHLAYMSSAGLRVVLSCQKKMNASGGSMLVRNANDLIMEIFETTGFVDILTIENDA